MGENYCRSCFMAIAVTETLFHSATSLKAMPIKFINKARKSLRAMLHIYIGTEVVRGEARLQETLIKAGGSGKVKNQ